MESSFEEITLSELINVLLRKWWIILISVTVCSGLAFFYTYYYLEPIYQSDTTLYVGKDEGKEEAIAYADLILGERLVYDYEEIVKSRLVTGRVIEDLELDISTSALAKKVNVAAKEDTRIIQITVENKSSEQAKKIANKIAEVFEEKVVEIMQVENVQIIDTAIAKDIPVKPNKRMNMAISVVLGLILGALIILAIEYFDQSIKTVEDIDKAVDLPVLGMIPEFPENTYEKTTFK